MPNNNSLPHVPIGQSLGNHDFISRRTLLKSGACAAGLLLTGAKIVWAASPESKYSRELTELLNLALQHEHGAFVQYANHAGLLSYWLDSNHATAIKAIIADEVEHAVILSNALKKSGAEPTLAVWPPQTGDTPSRVLIQDIAAEQGAVNLYSRILDFDMDDDLRNNLENIVRSEQSHKEIFEGMLKEIQQ
ncbi:ferritin-like domain-containing protein [Desulfonatronovibrio magnus]|uniref:ferritin-like domain-containing protein n=1 Tax=Desulfonatronovibrio magnus TaxID=698827 RepID=UPI0005EB28E7|nr:ferritin-like domain-containing protein [Desulfonatronovibrio magnus]